MLPLSPSGSSALGSLPSGSIWPAVAPFDPTNPANASFLSARLQELRSDDSNVRVNAFNGLRSTPHEQIRAAWTGQRLLTPPPGFEPDCLHRLWVEPPKVPLQGRRAFITIGSSGYETMLRDMLNSLALRGECPDVPVVVFCIGDEVYQALTDTPNVVRLRCQAAERLSAAVKGAIYSCARWLGFETMIALEADTLVVGELNSLFERVENGPQNAFYGCRSQVRPHRYSLREVLGHMNAPRSDLQWLTGREEHNAPFYFNGGLLAAPRTAWSALDAGFEAFNPFVSLWVEGAFHSGFLDEFAMNLVLGLSPYLLPEELPPTYNVQIIDANVKHWVSEIPSENGSHFRRLNEPAHVLHFIQEKRRHPTTAKRLISSSVMPTSSPSAPANGPTNGMLRCRACHVQKSCGSCFEPSTIAVERLASGARSALCRLCYAKRQSQPLDDVPLDVRLELETSTELPTAQ